MNYIKEINAFYDRLEFIDLSPSAVTLWHALMHMNNKIRWQESFTVSMKVLCLKSKLPESTFKRVRRELVDKGFITFESRGNRAPVYRMNSLLFDDGDGYAAVKEITNPKKIGADLTTAVTDSDAKTIQDEMLVEEAVSSNILSQQTGERKTLGIKNAIPASCQPDQAPDPYVNQQMSQQVSPLIKHKQEENNNKQNNDHHQPVYDFFRENFGKLTGYIQKEIAAYIKNASEEAVMDALKRALDYNKPNWNYAKKILENRKKETVNKVSINPYHKHVYKRFVPEWINDPKAFSAMSGNRNPVTSSEEDKQISGNVAKEKEEILQFIADFAKHRPAQRHSF